MTPNLTEETLTMKNWKNIALALLAVILLAGFAFLTPAPSITDEAYDLYQGLTEE